MNGVCIQTRARVETALPKVGKSRSGTAEQPRSVSSQRAVKVPTPHSGRRRRRRRRSGKVPRPPATRPRGRPLKEAPSLSTNPNPARITEAMWWFWLEFDKIEPTVRLGGIYNNKSGYHNTRANNDA